MDDLDQVTGFRVVGELARAPEHEKDKRSVKKHVGHKGLAKRTARLPSKAWGKSRK